MNDNINKLIPEAIKAIKKSKMAENNVVPKEFKGYISSMGASILQTGLLATISFYANDSGKNADSSYLLDAIHRLINPTYKTDNFKLITYVINRSKKTEINDTNIGVEHLDFDKLYLVEEEITDVLIALKLALRTYKLSQS